MDQIPLNKKKNKKIISKRLNWKKKTQTEQRPCVLPIAIVTTVVIRAMVVCVSFQGWCFSFPPVNLLQSVNARASAAQTWKCPTAAASVVCLVAFNDQHAGRSPERFELDFTRIISNVHTFWHVIENLFS